MKLGADTFYVVRAATYVDPIGNGHVRDWAHATQTLVIDANVQPFPLSPRSSKEVTVDRDFQETMFQVFAPAGTDVIHTDKVLFDDTMYEVYGAANNWRTLQGVAHHVEFLIVLRTG